jgi:hypothetical protein
MGVEQLRAENELLRQENELLRLSPRSIDYGREKEAQVIPSTLTAFGIELTSRYGSACDLIQMIKFAADCYRKKVNIYVKSVFENGQCGVTTFELDDRLVADSPVSNLILVAAKTHIGQFDWFDGIQHTYAEDEAMADYEAAYAADQFNEDAVILREEAEARVAARWNQREEVGQISDNTITMSDGNWRITISNDDVCEITDADGAVTHKTRDHSATARHLAMAIATVRKLQRDREAVK